MKYLQETKALLFKLRYVLIVEFTLSVIGTFLPTFYNGLVSGFGLGMAITMLLVVTVGKASTEKTAEQIDKKISMQRNSIQKI